jgi:hypothetical protein
MNRKTILTLALASAFALSTTGSYAQSDEKPEAPKPELIAEGDEAFPKGSSPELIAQSDEKPEAPKPELVA